MNVCLANDSFPPLYDGVANTVINYARIIQERYGNAAVAVPRYPNVTDDYPFEVVRYGSIDTTRLVGYRAGVPFTAHGMRRLAEFMPDVIHCHCPVASAVLCRQLRENTGAPMILTYHTKFDIDIHRAIESKLFRETAIKFILDNIKSADEVWVVNRGAGENLRSLGYDGDYRIMLNGVEFENAPAPEEEQRAVSDEFALTDGIPVLLFVGRMIRYKGIWIILDGLKKLMDSGVDFRMLFVGDGDDLAEAKEYARSLGISGKTVFAGAVRDRKKLRAIYSRADLFLLPSVFDNNPIVVKEAAACSTASVLIRGSSSAEGVTDGVNAVLIGESADELASALKRLAGNPELFSKLGHAASRDLYLSWEDSVAGAVARYSDVIRAYRAGETQRMPAHLDNAIEAVSEVFRALEKLRQPLSDRSDKT